MSSVPPGSWPPPPPPAPREPPAPSHAPPPPAPPAPPDSPAPAAREASPDPLPPWPAWTAPAALLTAFALAIVGGLVIAIVGSAFGASLRHPPPAVSIAATIMQDAAFVGAALFYASRFAPLAPSQFGLRRTPLWSAIGRILLLLLVFYVLSGMWAALVHVKERDQLPHDLGVHTSTAALVAVCLLVTVIAPVAEELLFRGYFFTALRGWRGPWVAAVVTGLVFGAIHVLSAPVAFLAPLALLGFLLCWLRWKTDSLLPCMAVHALNNAIAFGVNEVHWNAWQVILLILGANAAILLAFLPFLDARRRPAVVRA